MSKLLKVGDIIETSYSGVRTYHKVLRIDGYVPIVIACLKNGDDYPHYPVKEAKWNYDQWPIGEEYGSDAFGYNVVVGNVNQ